MTVSRVGRVTRGAEGRKKDTGMRLGGHQRMVL